MLQSVDDLKDCAINVLKSIGKIELLLDDEELILLHQSVLFLTNFKQLTEIVRDANQALCGSVN